MKQFRTFLAICVLSILSMSTVYGQDLTAATETFNAGAVALNESNYPVAIESFNKALKMLEGLGEEGSKLLADTKAIIPRIHLRYGRQLAEARDINNATVQLKKAIETGTLYSNADVVKQATDVLPQLLLAEGDKLLNEGKFAEALVEYKKIAAADPSDGMANLRIGIAESRLENEAGAIAAFEKAVTLGFKEDASKQLANLYLKKSVAAYKVKNWAAMFDAAEKSDTYSESGQAKKLVGFSAVQLKKFDKAIVALESYYAEDTNAKDKSTTLYNLATSYEGKGDIAKACGYYKQLLSDPTYKAAAEYKVKTKPKCK